VYDIIEIRHEGPAPRKERKWNMSAPKTSKKTGDPNPKKHGQRPAISLAALDGVVFCKRPEFWFRRTLGGRTWKIYLADKIVSPDANKVALHGIMFDEPRRIYVRRTADLEMLREVLIHEMVHAALADMNSDDEDEDFVEALGRGLMQLLGESFLIPKMPT
jgi:hypothetical protein